LLNFLSTGTLVTFSNFTLNIHHVTQQKVSIGTDFSGCVLTAVLSGKTSLSIGLISITLELEETVNQKYIYCNRAYTSITTI